MDIRLRFALVGLALFVVQLAFIPFIGVLEFKPDVLVLWLVYIGIRRGHIEATLAGFAIGLMQDAVTIQLFGLAALSKAVAGFLAGYFFTESTAEQTLGSYRFLVAVSLVSIAHNVIYYGIFFQGMDQSVFLAMSQLTLGTTLYTSIVAILPMFAFSRAFRTQWTQ